MGQQQQRQSPKERVDAIVQRQRESYSTIERKLAACAGQLAKALPKSAGIVAEQFTRVLMTSITTNRDLLMCTLPSIVQGAFEAAALGLRIDSVLGHAYLIPFKNKATLMIGYRGYQELAFRSGKVGSLRGFAVCEHDWFEYDLGTEAFFKHRKALADRGKLVAAFGVARLLGSTTPLVDMLNADEVEKRRKVSKTAGRNDSPWQQWPEEMWAKTAIRHISKQVPQSPELQRVALADEARDFGYRAQLVPDAALEAADAIETAAHEVLGEDNPGEQEPSA